MGSGNIWKDIVESQDKKVYLGNLNSTGNALFLNLSSGYTGFYSIFIDTFLLFKIVYKRAFHTIGAFLVISTSAANMGIF